MINPGNAVAIPWSWAVLHLPAILHARNAKSGGMPNQATFAYGSCILSLTAGFCRIVSNLERAMSQHGFFFGRARPPAFIRRRNFDFLATVALNLGNWPLPLRGISELINQVQAVGRFNHCRSNGTNGICRLYHSLLLQALASSDDCKKIFWVLFACTMERTKCVSSLLTTRRLILFI